MIIRKPNDLPRRPGLPLLAGIASSVCCLLSLNSSPAAAPVAAAVAADSSPSVEAIAAYTSAQQYVAGKEVAKDDKKALELFQKASDLGHPDATASVGYFYSVGMVVEKDEVKARQLFEAAAVQGSALGKVKFARYLIVGTAGAKDINRGIEILQGMADQGSKTATTMLGEVFFWGEHGDNTPDYARAFPFFKRLADSGDANAQNYVGVMIRDQRMEGYPPDSAREWFLRAAQQGNGKACNNLGQWKYESADRAERIEALKWILVGKQLKDVTAAFFLESRTAFIKDDEMKEAWASAEETIAALDKK